MSKARWRLIVGLGNPGKQYQKTYHNLGILALDELLKNLPSQNRLAGRTLKNFWYAKAGQQIWVKPSCFMNESGRAVLQALRYFKIQPEETLIIHDDADILFGRHKLSFGRGSAGHRGVQSIIDHLGTNKFWRLRLGIRKKFNIKSGNFVLQRLNKNDEAALRRQILEIQTLYFQAH